MNVFFIGDIVGGIGRKAVEEVLPKIKAKFRPDWIIANGENAAAGRGITEKIANELFNLGIHGITLGNHVWDNKSIFDFIDRESRIVRPANYPEGTPGAGYTVLKSGGKELAVVNLQGRTFLPPLACPFQAADQILHKLGNGVKAVLVDFHAEATSEKLAMGWHLDGRVSAVLGTHTHVQTHDETILPRGTSYVTDVGMVGSREGILGMERNAVLQKFRTQMPVRFSVAEGKWQFHGTHLRLNDKTGMAEAVQLVRIYEDDVWLD